MAYISPKLPIAFRLRKGSFSDDELGLWGGRIPGRCSRGIVRFCLLLLLHPFFCVFFFFFFFFFLLLLLLEGVDRPVESRKEVMPFQSVASSFEGGPRCVRTASRLDPHPCGSHVVQGVAGCLWKCLPRANLKENSSKVSPCFF